MAHLGSRNWHILFAGEEHAIYKLVQAYGTHARLGLINESFLDLDCYSHVGFDVEESVIGRKMTCDL